MSLVLVDIADRVATITLNNPDERNTLTAPMVAEIVAAFDAIEADDGVGAVVVTGAPPAFCAGANLGNLGSAEGPGFRSIYEGFLRVGRCPLPTLAAVNGAAVGAGMNLALVCDVRVAARRARFDTRFLQIGIHPGGGHTWMLQRIAGPQVGGGHRAVRRGARRRAGRARRAGLAHRRRRGARHHRPRPGGPGRRSAPRAVDRHEGDAAGHGHRHRARGRRRPGAHPAGVVARSSRGSPNGLPRSRSASRPSRPPPRRRRADDGRRARSR